MGLKSNEIDHLLIRQLKQTANKPVTRLVLLTGFNTPPTPSQEGRQLQPVNKQMIQFFLNSQYRCSFLLQFLFPEEGFQIIIISIYNRDIHLHIVHFRTCAMQQQEASVFAGCRTVIC